MLLLILGFARGVFLLGSFGCRVKRDGSHV